MCTAVFPIFCSLSSSIKPKASTIFRIAAVLLRAETESKAIDKVRIPAKANIYPLKLFLKVSFTSLFFVFSECMFGITLLSQCLALG